LKQPFQSRPHNGTRFPQSHKRDPKNKDWRRNGTFSFLRPCLSELFLPFLFFPFLTTLLFFEIGLTDLSQSCRGPSPLFNALISCLGNPEDSLWSHSVRNFMLSLSWLGLTLLLTLCWRIDDVAFLKSCGGLGVVCRWRGAFKGEQSFDLLLLTYFEQILGEPLLSCFLDLFLLLPWPDYYCCNLTFLVLEVDLSTATSLGSEHLANFAQFLTLLFELLFSLAPVIIGDIVKSIFWHHQPSNVNCNWPMVENLGFFANTYPAAREFQPRRSCFALHLTGTPWWRTLPFGFPLKCHWSWKGPLRIRRRAKEISSHGLEIVWHWTN